MRNENIKKKSGNKKIGSYIVGLIMLLLIFLLLPGVALAETVSPNLTGYHFWQLQQGLIGADNLTDGTSLPVEPVTAPISGTRVSDLKNGTIVSEPISTRLGRTTRLTFNIGVSNNIIVTGNVSAGGLQPGTYINSLDIYLEFEETPGNRVKFLDRSGNPVKIPVITEKILVEQSSLTFPIYTILNVAPHEMLDKNPRWVSYMTVGKPGLESTAVYNGYQNINGWLSACTATLFTDGLTADNGLVLSNVTVDGKVYSLPNGTNIYQFSRPLGDLSSATLSVDVHAASVGTYNVNSMASLDFDPYTVRDLSSSVTVPFTITANRPPVAVDDYSSTNQNTPVTISVLANDSDPDNDSLTVVNTTPAANGTVTVNTDGTIVYSPDKDFFGYDTFTYTITDGYGGYSTANVYITINGLPVAVDDFASINRNTPVTISVLDNDSDPDNDPLAVVSTTPAANGIVRVNSDGTIVYSPNLDFLGLDSFTYTITDGNGGFSTANVYITIKGLPIAVDDFANTNQNTPVLISVLTNDYDPDNDPLTVVSVTPAANGTVSVNADGTILYSPKTGYYGHDSFSYTITDGNGGYSTANVYINIIALFPINGLTPGYWSNWQNHYESTQFGELLAGTFVKSDINAANNVFSSYSSKKGMEISILKAHLLACQLTFSLVNNPEMSNPDQAYLKINYEINFDGQYISIGDAINQALAIVANPSLYSRDQIIKVKDILDVINNL